MAKQVFAMWRKPTGMAMMTAGEGVRDVLEIGRMDYLMRGARLIAPHLPLFIFALFCLLAQSVVRATPPTPPPKRRPCVCHDIATQFANGPRVALSRACGAQASLVLPKDAREPRPVYAALLVRRPIEESQQRATRRARVSRTLRSQRVDQSRNCTC